MREIRKALTIRASSIGDGLMGKYLLENIHVAYPHATCSLLVAGKSAMIRNLLAAYPWIRVIEANTRVPGSIFSAFGKLFPSDATVTQYSGRGSFSTASKLFGRLVTRFGRFAGFTDTWPLNRFIFDHLLPFSMRRAMRLHECDALDALGVPVSLPELTLVPVPGNDVLTRLSLIHGSYIVLNLFSGSRARGLALAHQQEIARSTRSGWDARKHVVLTGGPSDEQAMQQIGEAVPGLIIAPKLSMQDLITLVAESAAVVSLDTGVAHMAAQTGAPLVVLRTCWGYNWWTKEQYPRSGITVLAHDELCTERHAVAGDVPACLGAISSEEVVTALESLV